MSQLFIVMVNKRNLSVNLCNMKYSKGFGACHLNAMDDLGYTECIVRDVIKGSLIRACDRM